MNLILSPKFKEFIMTQSERDYLEGTTAAGKTTVGIFKFMLKVAMSDDKYHCIAGADLGTVEKNIINSECGLIAQMDGLAEYFPKGQGKITLPHIKYATGSGQKIIYITGYDNKSRWKKVLGSQFGCVYIDEVNTADMEFLREITHRCKYMMTTSNPDAPDKEVYKEFLNHSRPLKKYVSDYPEELLKELNEEYVPGWIHWYFTFYDNASMTEKDIQKKKSSVPKGTKMYKNKIQGLRGKATGLVFCNFDKRRHVITKQEAKKYIRNPLDKTQSEWFEYFTSGLDTSYSSQSPDTIAMSYIGITNKGKCILLDEKVYNNASLTIPIAPSDTVKNWVDFLERNRKEWGGISRNIFIDSADQATKKEFDKYKRAHPECLYIINDAWKKVTIIDRIQMQLGWMHYDDEAGIEPNYFIVDTCTNYIGELDKYSWKEDKDQVPEDGNDHMVNSTQYGWIPYADKIGLSR